MRDIISTINNRIILITLSISFLIIVTALLLPVFDVYHMTVGQYIWLVAAVILGYIAPIIRTVLTDSVVSYKKSIDEIQMKILLIMSPIVMVLSLIIIIIFFVNNISSIHIFLFLFSSSGFYIEAYKHKDEIKDDYHRMNDSINQMRDNQYNKF